LKPEPQDFRGYEDITSERGEPRGYEYKPSITAFPFYKLRDRRPYWSVFQYGRQQELSVVMTPTTARLLNIKECNPGLHTDKDANTFKKDLQVAAEKWLPNLTHYHRVMLLHLGRGYAAYDIMAKLLERPDFEPLMVDLATAVREPGPH